MLIVIKCITIYFLIINIILFFNSTKRQNVSGVFVQCLIYYLPVLILIMFLLKI